MTFLFLEYNKYTERVCVSLSLSLSFFISLSLSFCVFVYVCVPLQQEFSLFRGLLRVSVRVFRQSRAQKTSERRLLSFAQASTDSAVCRFRLRLGLHCFNLALHDIFIFCLPSIGFSARWFHDAHASLLRLSIYLRTCHLCVCI